VTERQRERDRDRERDRERERQRQRERDRERKSDRERQRQRQTKKQCSRLIRSDYRCCKISKDVLTSRKSRSCFSRRLSMEQNRLSISDRNSPIAKRILALSETGGAMVGREGDGCETDEERRVE
jgi:hypothetical protein